MPRYDVGVMTSGGMVYQVVSAVDEKRAKRMASKEGEVVVCKKKAELPLSKKMKMSTEARYIFFERLATMIDSGIGVTKALRLIKNTFPGSTSRAASGLHDMVEQGVPLQDAIAEDRRNFPQVVSMLVRAGTRGGKLTDALRNAAKFETEMNEVGKQSQKAIWRGLAFIGVSSGICLAMVYYFGPKILEEKFFEKAGQVDVGDFEILALVWGWSGAIVSTVMLMIIFLATVGRISSPVWAESVLMKIPAAKHIVLAQDAFVTMKKLALMFGGGASATEALSTAIDGSKKGVLQQELKASLDKARTSNQWATELGSIHATDRASLLTAEDSAKFSMVLESVAEQNQRIYINMMNVVGPSLEVIGAFGMTAAGIAIFGLAIAPILEAVKNVF